MKTIIIAILMLGISVCSHAQNHNLSPFQKKTFNKNLQNDTTKYFAISPRFKSKTLPHDFKYSQRFHGDPFQFNNPDSMLSFENSPDYELRMPVASNKFYSNMPIAIPDSSVHYYLRVKRIPFVNPLTGK